MTADEERYADSLVGRPPGCDPVCGGDELCRHHLSDRGPGTRARSHERIEPLAKFFHDAEMQVRVMSTPPSLSGTQGQYVDAIGAFSPTLPPRC